MFLSDNEAPIITYMKALLFKQINAMRHYDHMQNNTILENKAVMEL
jgi:hypothetical protein